MKTLAAHKLDHLVLSDAVFFVRYKKALVPSLFQGPATPSGFFKVRKNGVLFLDLDGNPFAFLVANKHGERFFVTCRKTDETGELRFMYSLCLTDLKKLGLEHLSFLKKMETAERIWREVKGEGSF